MESKSFNAIDDKKLIDMVRNHSVLYKLNDKNYKDNCVKENVWKEIAHSIGKNVNDCKTRWRTIRDSYKKNLKKRKLGTGSAATTKSKYNDDSLNFLDNIEDERRTTSNILMDKIACNDSINYSEMTENESFNQTEETEPKTLLLENSESILLKINTPIDDQLLTKEINHSLLDAFRKKQTIPRTQDKILDEIKKRREAPLMALREMRKYECNDSIQFFFKSMALTVSTFPPELAVEAKMKVFNIISEMELRLLKAKVNMNTTSVKPMTLTSSTSADQVPTIFSEEESSRSTLISSNSE
ncbi:BESS motif,MADF domain,SANT/Myb domain,Myb-like domain [Cinara cedri]|uniref:BESS motif,MADF domain,SANT/Myb domain,Myb-like domain n=1 Tax=Cinara cedri TaxID=506608 RepID=A0A5E4MPK3_9HEMI|nr:BESS motif,MADF domain,SANT/Myb domain,Myb-like domain [Cinara cedri]